MPLKPATVVITRPLAQAQTLAAAVRALGFDPVVFPLLDIAPLADDAHLRATLARIDSFALVAFVSPNAIDAAFAARPDWPPGVTLAVMGEGSRAALARHGVDDGNTRIVSPRDSRRTDSATLLEALDPAALAGKPVLIVRGESGRELLADALRSAGAEVTQVAAYRRGAPVLDAERAARFLGLLEARATWIVTSSESLRFACALARTLDAENGVARLQQQKLIVPHLRIEETAHELGFRQVRLTGSGDSAMLAALQS
jgi:uroporphyrinogen-III synthase